LLEHSRQSLSESWPILLMTEPISSNKVLFEEVATQNSTRLGDSSWKPSRVSRSSGCIRRGLGSIPEVKDAIREAWLTPEGLRRQLEAAFRGEEVPTWPVVIFAENVAG
jgi:hypothetical protein